MNCAGKLRQMIDKKAVSQTSCHRLHSNVWEIIDMFKRCIIFNYTFLRTFHNQSYFHQRSWTRSKFLVKSRRLCYDFISITILTELKTRSKCKSFTTPGLIGSCTLIKRLAGIKSKVAKWHILWTENQDGWCSHFIIYIQSKYLIYIKWREKIGNAL